ncbi:hypothetical protein M3Y98_00280400 [Aphelenchoides besseyi]|nr:hypothetical protein M3Y98_00280400 [Aphelenchoides besseyi]
MEPSSSYDYFRMNVDDDVLIDGEVQMTPEDETYPDWNNYGDSMNGLQLFADSTNERPHTEDYSFYHDDRRLTTNNWNAFSGYSFTNDYYHNTFPSTSTASTFNRSVTYTTRIIVDHNTDTQQFAATSTSSRVHNLPASSHSVCQSIPVVDLNHRSSSASQKRFVVRSNKSNNEVKVLSTLPKRRNVLTSPSKQKNLCVISTEAEHSSDFKSSVTRRKAMQQPSCLRHFNKQNSSANSNFSTLKATRAMNTVQPSKRLIPSRPPRSSQFENESSSAENHAVDRQSSSSEKNKPTFHRNTRTQQPIYSLDSNLRTTAHINTLILREGNENDNSLRLYKMNSKTKDRKQSAVKNNRCSSGREYSSKSQEVDEQNEITEHSTGISSTSGNHLNSFDNLHYNSKAEFVELIDMSVGMYNPHPCRRSHSTGTTELLRRVKNKELFPFAFSMCRTARQNSRTQQSKKRVECRLQAKTFNCRNRTQSEPIRKNQLLHYSIPLASSLIHAKNPLQECLHQRKWETLKLTRAEFDQHIRSVNINEVIDANGKVYMEWTVPWVVNPQDMLEKPRGPNGVDIRMVSMKSGRSTHIVYEATTKSEPNDNPNNNTATSIRRSPRFNRTLTKISDSKSKNISTPQRRRRTRVAIQEARNQFQTQVMESRQNLLNAQRAYQRTMERVRKISTFPLDHEQLQIVKSVFDISAYFVADGVSCPDVCATKTELIQRIAEEMGKCIVEVGPGNWQVIRSDFFKQLNEIRQRACATNSKVAKKKKTSQKQTLELENPISRYDQHEYESTQRITVSEHQTPNAVQNVNGSLLNSSNTTVSNSTTLSGLNVAKVKKSIVSKSKQENARSSVSKCVSRVEVTSNNIREPEASRQRPVLTCTDSSLTSAIEEIELTTEILQPPADKVAHIFVKSDVSAVKYKIETVGSILSTSNENGRKRQLNIEQTTIDGNNSADSRMFKTSKRRRIDSHAGFEEADFDVSSCESEQVVLPSSTNNNNETIMCIDEVKMNRHFPSLSDSNAEVADETCNSKMEEFSLIALDDRLELEHIPATTVSHTVEHNSTVFIVSQSEFKHNVDGPQTAEVERSIREQVCVYAKVTVRLTEDVTLGYEADESSGTEIDVISSNRRRCQNSVLKKRRQRREKQQTSHEEDSSDECNAKKLFAERQKRLLQWQSRLAVYRCEQRKAINIHLSEHIAAELDEIKIEERAQRIKNWRKITEERLRNVESEKCSIPSLVARDVIVLSDSDTELIPTRLTVSDFYFGQYNKRLQMSCNLNRKRSRISALTVGHGIKRDLIGKKHLEPRDQCSDLVVEPAPKKQFIANDFEFQMPTPAIVVHSNVSTSTETPQVSQTGFLTSHLQNRLTDRTAYGTANVHENEQEGRILPCISDMVVRYVNSSHHFPVNGTSNEMATQKMIEKLRDVVMNGHHKTNNLSMLNIETFNCLQDLMTPRPYPFDCDNWHEYICRISQHTQMRRGRLEQQQKLFHRLSHPLTGDEYVRAHYRTSRSWNIPQQGQRAIKRRSSLPNVRTFDLKSKINQLQKSNLPRSGRPRNLYTYSAWTTFINYLNKLMIEKHGRPSKVLQLKRMDVETTDYDDPIPLRRQIDTFTIADPTDNYQHLVDDVDGA